MANVINVSTLRYLRSVSTPSFPEPTWKHNPDMSAVDGVAKRYWEWDAVAERPVEMDQAAKDAVDAALLVTELDGAADTLDDVKAIVRAMAKLLVSEFNAHSDDINDILAAASTATSLATFKTAMAAINTRPQRTLTQFRTAMRNNLGS